MSYSQEEIKGLEQELRLIVLKMAQLRQSLILETNPSVKFQTEQELQDLDSRKAAAEQALADAFNLGSDSGKERLREKIKDLRISASMGRWHLVNCNRHDMRDRFEEGFDKRHQAGAVNHYYFLSACPSQLPPSLGERMVYELLGELLEESTDAVYCRFNATNHDRVKLEKMPLGYSLEKSKQLFREFCASWFGWGNQQDFSEAITANRLPSPKYKYTILPFKIAKKEWKPFFSAYFDWIAEELAKRPKGGPTLLVFFVFNIDDLHLYYDAATQMVSEKTAAEIITTIDGICARHEHTGHLYPLSPVDSADLIGWFNDLGEDNNARINPVIETLAMSLPPEELKQFRQSEQLNMDRVELVQEIVFELYNK